MTRFTVAGVICTMCLQWKTSGAYSWLLSVWFEAGTNRGSVPGHKVGNYRRIHPLESAHNGQDAKERIEWPTGLLAF